RVAVRLQRNRFLVTVGFWNADDDFPRFVADKYLKALAAMQGGGSDCLSIKLPALGYSYDLLQEVLIAAKNQGIRIHFDSLGLDTVDQTLSTIDRALGIYNDIGITIPAGWR